MSIVRRHAIYNVIIRRARDISGTDRTSTHATATVDAAIQTLTREARSVQGIGLDEKALVAWFEVDQDIQEGDVIEISDPSNEHNGEIFTVREITIRDYGINQHMEALLTEFNE